MGKLDVHGIQHIMTDEYKFLRSVKKMDSSCLQGDIPPWERFPKRGHAHLWLRITELEGPPRLPYPSICDIKSVTLN